ncbi:hypothetical protein HYDPIDRAFT_105469 [Hydnomerulius pinastri MD-312]|nr:hypothetical protein HYDPIDRAFT_105469 [Hydnomerulius pinastri MD-312]
MNFGSSSSSAGQNGLKTSSNGLTSDVFHQSEKLYEDDGPNQSAAPSLPVSNGYSHTPYQMHNEEIVHHLYNAGFQTGNYADTILHIHQNSYRLHAIILSRSPFLVHLMSTSLQTGGQRIIYVQLDHEPEVTQEGFAIALGYLYSSVSISLIRPENARGVLAAGCLLGGMEDLCGYAYEACRRSISVETITEWLEFIDSIPLSSDGSLTPEQPLTPVFGQYARRLREDVFHFLVVALPNALEVYSPAVSESGSSQGHAGRDTLLQIFSLVPFDMFKAAVESPTFQIGSDQCRFKFAKDAIELRKRGIARGHGAEETVVLAFGGGHMGGSAVHVTRKMRKRPLWKVNS